MPAAPDCARVTSHVDWYPVSANVSPLQPSARQWRLENCAWSFEFVPMPCSRIAVALSALKPARFQSTDVRMIENGIASTTLSAVTCLLVPPCLKVSAYDPLELRTIAT